MSIVKPHWTRKPCKAAFATNEGWEMMYFGKQKVIKPHKGLLNTLKAEGYDMYGDPLTVGEGTVADAVGEVAEPLPTETVAAVSVEADSVPEKDTTISDNKEEKAGVVATLMETIQQVKRGRGRPRKDGGAKA